MDLDTKIWKELAIEKQMLMRTVTDSLGLDPKADEAVLKARLAEGMARITQAEALIKKANDDNAAALAALQKKLDDSDKALREARAAIDQAAAAHAALEVTLTGVRESASVEAKNLRSQLEARNREIKNIHTALADSPENVVKKMKALNKKKFDEGEARKRAETDLKNKKKENRELADKLARSEAQFEKLATDYKELRTVSETQHEQLKGLVDEVAPLPEANESFAGIEEAA